ncbi:MAG: CocE/NonD family hydrolase, partial [Gemmatimonadota bacterium]
MSSSMTRPLYRPISGLSVLRTLPAFGLLLVMALGGVSACGHGSGGAAALTGDWDYYVMLGAEPSGGFEAKRRFGFAHFEGADAKAAWLKRRPGTTLETVSGIRAASDSVIVDFASGASIRAVASGDTIAGRFFRGSTPINRVWLVRRNGPAVFEPYYALWAGPTSDSTYAVTIDTAVPMHARDGTVLMSFVGRPVGEGPFGVVMERTPYLRWDTANAVFWASRGYIYVKQDVRGRGGSGGVLDMNAMQESDGYDAVEWAASLPGSNGKVGMIGRSNPGLYAWYAAIAAPPHLTTIAPVVATADPIRLVPYIDMVFSPTIVPWLCFTAVKNTLSDMSNLDLVSAFRTLPVIESSDRAGCPRRQFWNDWFDH